MNHRLVKYVLAFTSAFAMTMGDQRHASAAMGQASATVIREIVSAPIVIRLQASQTNVQSTSAGFSIDGYRSASSGSSEPSSAGLTLVGIDAAGVATFSVSGDTTSGYVVQVAGGEGAGGQSQVATSGVTDLGNANTTAELIVPAQALIGGGRLSIVVSQASIKGRVGEMSVQINYN